VRFAPGEVLGGRMEVDMKTAASITLALQAILPAVSLSGSALEVEIVGGTDVAWSPTFDYFATVVRPCLALLGMRVELEAKRRGYYPVGGGIVRASVRPCLKVQPLDLTVPGDPPLPSVKSRCGSLPVGVARRQCDSAASRLKEEGLTGATEEVSLEPSDSPGSSVLVASVGGGIFVGGDAIGRRGLRAEAVGSSAAQIYLSALRSGACLDSHLADTIAPLLSMAAGTSRLRVPEVTGHLRTSLHVAELFTGCKCRFDPDGSTTLVSIEPGRP
jgi:RNA 3'-terminal phosphate cyclase (ATP)